MSAIQAYKLVIGLILLGFLEGIVNAFLPAFQLAVVFGFQTGIVGSILMTKLINDTREMKYGIKKNNGEEPK